MSGYKPNCRDSNLAKAREIFLRHQNIEKHILYKDILQYELWFRPHLKVNADLKTVPRIYPHNHQQRHSLSILTVHHPRQILYAINQYS